MSYQSDLYQQVILDHNKNPKNFREIAEHSHSCDGYNPLCGDKIKIWMNISPAGAVEDVSFSGSGCAISKASASMLTVNIKGKTVDEARVIFDEFHKMVIGEMDVATQKNHLGKLSIFSGVREFPSRIKCATLAWHTMVCALDKTGETTIE
ncbi:MAG: SUF system NifU family Fe-S cluster assembly protein [Nitrospinae bacterium]|nr:SUF system NifU family Fe-S cluster assembly protein [Nitrospinota bacterium]